MGVTAFVLQDWKANKGRAFAQGSLVVYRVGHLLATTESSSWLLKMGRMFWKVVHILVIKIIGSGDIEPEAKIGPNFELPHGFNGVFISGHAEIGRSVVVYHQVTIGSDPRQGDWTAPRIGDGAFIGVGAKLFGPVTVGEGAVIGANAVVCRDVSANSVAVGAPAREIQGAGRAAVNGTGADVPLDAPVS